MTAQSKRSVRKASRRPITESTRQRMAEAIALHQQGKVPEAMVIYQRILRAYPNYPDALHFLGVAEHQLGRSESALELILRAIRFHPDYPDAHNNLGNVCKQLGQLEQAETAYRRTLELRPNDANALCNLGTVRREQGELNDAIYHFRAVIGLYPEHAEAWQNLGNTLGALHRYEEALDAHREALRLRPHSSDSYRYLGAMFASLGKVAEATDVYRQWLNVSPRDPQALHLLAACTGEGTEARASDEFVRTLFDKFANSFDKNLARLEYRAPNLVLSATHALNITKCPHWSVLDAGCGTGLCGPLFRPLASRLIGVDLSQRMVERAKERAVYDELVVEELTQFIQRHPDEYDLIVSADTLVYFGALNEVVHAVFRALVPGALSSSRSNALKSNALPKGTV